MAEFATIVDVAAVQRLMDKFHAATGVPVSIITVEGEVLVGPGWQDACTRFLRACPEAARLCERSDRSIKDRLEEGTRFVTYTCPLGLVDAAAPIVVDGSHTASVFTGQFLFTVPDAAALDRFRAQAHRYGFEEEDYLEAIRSVPVIPETRLGPILELVSGFAEFIGEMGFASLMRVKAEGDLRKSEERFRSLVESYSDHMFMLDLEGVFLFSNNRTEGLSLVEGETPMGKRLEDVYPHDVAGSYRERFHEVIATGRPVRFEHSLPGGEGVRHHVDTLYPILKAGCLWAVGGICRDITVQKRAQDALIESRQQLFQAQKMDVLGTLVAGMAHEINNPVNLIMFNAPLMRKVWADLKPVLDAHAPEQPGRKYGGLTKEFLDANFDQLIADMELAAGRVSTIVAGLKGFSRRSDVREKETVSLNEGVGKRVAPASRHGAPGGSESGIRAGREASRLAGAPAEPRADRHESRPQRGPGHRPRPRAHIPWSRPGTGGGTA